MNESSSAARPSILAMIDELLTDAGTEVRPNNESIQPASQSHETTTAPTTRKITPREFEKTVYARMQMSKRKQEENLRASHQRAEERLKREAYGHPVISPDAKELKRPPLYRRSIELEKEQRKQREKLHEEKLVQEREKEEQMLREKKAAEEKVRALCRRDPREFFEFNLQKVKQREEELEGKRLEKAEQEIAGLDFRPVISQKSKKLAQKNAPLLQRLEDEQKRRRENLHMLERKYTPSFQPEIAQSRLNSIIEEQAIGKLYPNRRHSESPKRVRASEECSSPPRTNRMNFLSIDAPISEET